MADLYCKDMEVSMEIAQGDSAEKESFPSMWEALGSTSNTANQPNNPHLPRVNHGTTSLRTGWAAIRPAQLLWALHGCSEETPATNTTVTMASALGDLLQSQPLQQPVITLGDYTLAIKTLVGVPVTAHLSPGGIQENFLVCSWLAYIQGLWLECM